MDLARSRVCSCFLFVLGVASSLVRMYTWIVSWKHCYTSVSFRALKQVGVGAVLLIGLQVLELTFFVAINILIRKTGDQSC